MMFKKLGFIICSFIFTVADAQTINVKHLSLDLQFDWQTKQAFGTAEITFTPIASTSKIYLDAGNLTIHSIITNNEKLNFQNMAKDKLEIDFKKVYQPSETVKIIIHYNTNYENQADPNAISGSFGKGLRFQQPTSTTPNKRRQIWSSGEPHYNKYWFPCNEDIADIHTTEIKATLEKPLMLIGNGTLLSITENKNNTRTFYYKAEQPFPNYLVSIVVGEFVDFTQKCKETTIHNFGYPPEEEAVKATVELLPDMMNFLEEKTSVRYPFEQYSQVVVQDYPFPGLVGQHTVSILSDNYIDDYGVHKDFKYLWDGVAMQALANQWFGNLIMPKAWDDVWLNNAFAQYFAGLYTLKSNSPSEYLTYYYPFEKLNVLTDWDSGNKHPVVTNSIKDLFAFNTDSYSKFKGALVLRMLQKELGEERWWKTIQYYVKTFAHRQVSTKDFQSSVEKIAGKSYQWFFDQWIYKMGLPKLEIFKTYLPAEKKLRIAVKQIQSQEDKTEFPQTAFFEGKILIETDGKLETVLLKPQAENIFTIPVNNEPKFVNFNFEESFLCEMVFDKSTDEYLYQLKLSRDVLAKQQALDKLADIAKDSTTSTVLKQKIYEAFVTEIQSRQYWRYRLYALGSLQKIIALPYDNSTINLLQQLINTEQSWLKSSAINILGKTNNANFADLYIAALNDESDRVINAAAIALGKTKSPKAYPVLVNLENKPSWKNQNRISALNGLQQLGDDSAINYVLTCLEDNHSPRWYLATPIWDYPFAAVNTLASLGKAALGYPILFERLKASLKEDDINDIFQNVQLINLLKDERAKEIYPLLKDKFKNEKVVLEAVSNYEKQFLDSITK